MEDIDHCLGPFKRYINSTTDVIFPQYNSHTMEDMCIDFTSVRGCLDDVRPSCREVVQTVFDGILDSFVYLCSDSAQKVYQNNIACLSATDVQRSAEKCRTTFSLKSAHVAITKSLGGDAYKREFCRVANWYLKCVRESVSSSCGPEAAEWEDGLNRNALRKTLTFINCRLEGEWLEEEVIVMTAIISMIFVMMVPALVSYVRLKLNARITHPTQTLPTASSAGSSNSTLEDNLGDQATTDGSGDKDGPQRRPYVVGAKQSDMTDDSHSPSSFVNPAFLPESRDLHLGLM